MKIRQLEWKAISQSSGHKATACDIFFELYGNRDGMDNDIRKVYILSYWKAGNMGSGKVYFNSIEEAHQYAQTWHEANIKEYLE